MGNKGITASRSPEEIEWMFGERVADGRALILGLFAGERMEGYVIVSTDNGVLWSVKDIIVLGNNLNRLDKLLIGLKRFMLKCTPAVQCQITGYPTAVQATLSRHFPIKRALDNNQYFIHFQDEAKKLIDVNTLDSIRNWLFGAYEGDAAML